MKVKKNINPSRVDVFWESDLSSIEAEFLKKGQKITDLPTYLDRKVPHQGSVLLGRTVNLDDNCKKSFLLKINSFFARFSLL